MVQVLIRSGGQTGVDRAAIEFALQHNFPYCGWCPRGGWAEDYPIPPGLLKPYPNLIETPLATPLQRTAWNVRDSHATLILIDGDTLYRSPGTVFTKLCAKLIFLRPCLVVDIAQPEAIETTHQWLRQTIEPLSVTEFVLNLAGSRESEAPGIYAKAFGFLAQLFCYEY